MAQDSVRVRRSEDRGVTTLDWLDSQHSFSFGGYHDPTQMGFRSLRVINEDRVRPDKGFDTHPHANMEIISVVIEGSLEHRDNLGNGSVINVGDVQRMSAGTGIMHSEFNPSTTDDVHFLQIWIEPSRRGVTPGYEQKTFATVAPGEGLQLVGSSEGKNGSLKIHSDIALYRAMTDAGESLGHSVEASHHVWLQVIAGSVSVGEVALNAGDGAAISEMKRVSLKANAPSDFLLFDLW
ncbi:MAG: pirin family protein [bacterium]|nr:pirin family protein [bacterium]